jgi:phosphoglycerate dehydrogenase-like enzyme
MRTYLAAAATACCAAVPHFAWGGEQEDAARMSLRIERTIAAPRETVFRLWTDPQAVARWFLPPDRAHWAAPPKFEARRGGRFSLRLVSKEEFYDLHNADSVAEHALLLILALMRHLPTAQANVRAGILGAPLGRTLAGRTVCLYGLGATARALARRLHALGARLIGITRHPNAAKAAEFALDLCFGSSECGKALAQTEVLVLCVRLGHQTRGLIDSRALRALPVGAYLVNAARGGLIDYRALYHALASGHLGGVGLDVFWTEPMPPDDPLLELPNVIATPHVAGVTDRSYSDIADAVASNIERLRRGEPPLNRAA